MTPQVVKINFHVTSFSDLQYSLAMYTIGQKFGITSLKQTLWSESTRNGQAKMPLGRIGAPFIYASDEHNTVSVAKTVQELEAEN